MNHRFGDQWTHDSDNCMTFTGDNWGFQKWWIGFGGVSRLSINLALPIFQLMYLFPEIIVYATFCFWGLVEKMILTIFDWILLKCVSPYGFSFYEMVGGFKMVWV